MDYSFACLYGQMSGNPLLSIAAFMRLKLKGEHHREERE